MSTHPRRRLDLVVADFKEGAETVFLDENTERVVSLNPMATAIWYLCDGQRDATAIAGEVAEFFPAQDRLSIEADVRRTLESLAAWSLIV
jgi:hypothetical protein